MIQQIVTALNKSNRLIVASHMQPEGDAIGSIMALTMALEAMGKKPYPFNPSGVPRNLKTFPRAGDVSDKLPEWKPDTLVVLDCGDFGRIGKEASQTLKDVPTILNIDHHITNERFGHINWVDSNSASASEIAAKIIDGLGVEWTADMATWIFVAIHADTGGFRFSNTRPETLYTAGKMIERGADPAFVSRNLYGNIPAGNLALLSEVLRTLEVDRDRKTAFIKVTLDMFKQTGTTHEDVEGLIDFPRSLKDIDIAAVFRETGAGKFKVSLRSNGAVDVGAVAYSFGGGGHKEAAGFSVDGDLEQVKQKLVNAIANVSAGK